MSNSSNRKSMDDVLASIRRIVRSDVPPNDADGDTRREAAVPAVEPAPADEPLSLTPDMRVGEDTAAPQSAAPRPDPWSSPLDAVEDVAEEAEDALGQTTGAAGMDQQDDDALVLDEQALDQMIRDVIRDELVNGEIGRNISQNVQRMIAAEIVKVMKG